ncbi:MAG: hypothetical protein LUH15_09415 [Tannerellaceae bacterium]|nr:hypothetical protein [Tannerellaceae bacterium]
MNCKKFIALCVSVIALCTACSDEKQSSLDINSIKGTTVVEGKVSYDSGDIKTVEGEIKPNQYSAAAGKTVYLHLELSSLNSENSEEGGYEGRLVYTTTTNNDGSFEIEVPANNKGIGYKISIEGFKAQRSEYNAEKDNFVYKNYYFSNIEVEDLKAFENLGIYKEIKLGEDRMTLID